MIDDNFDDLLRDAAQTYNEPPAPPRDAMWSAIERARTARAVTPRTFARRTPSWLAAATGVAAVLLVGIAIGRMSRAPASVPETIASSASNVRPAVSRDSSVAVDAVTPAAVQRETVPAVSRRAGVVNGDRARDASRVANERANGAADLAGDHGAYRFAVVEHLARTEIMLAGFRSQVHSGAEAHVDVHFAVLSRDLLATTRLLLATRRGDEPAITRLLQDLELVLMQLSQYANDGRRADLDAIEQSLDKHNVMPKLRSTIPAGFSASSGT